MPPWYKKEKEKEEIDPEYFKGTTLGAKFGNTLIGFFKRIVNSITDWTEERLINFAVGVLVKIEVSGSTILGATIKKLKAENAIPDFLKPIFNEIEDPKHEIGAMLAQSASGSAIGGLFGAIFDPLLASTKYNLQKGITPYYPEVQHAILGRIIGDLSQGEEREILGYQGFDPKYHAMYEKIYKNQIPFGEIVSLYLRGGIREEQISEKLSLLGFDEFDIELLKKLIYKIPTVSESIIAHFRGDITEIELEEIANKNGIDKDFLNILVTANRKLIDIADIRTIYHRANKSDEWVNDKLEKLGYSDEAISDIKEIFPFFPSVGDLVRFSVREVYYPDYVTKYGLDDEYPSEYENEAKKAGLPPEQAKNYWRAHWELPSILQGYEMLHRGVISPEELGDLFKAVDIMPYWRSRLEAISYRVLSRVDVRRMFDVGVLDEAGVYEAYQHLGYNDDDAQKMTDFTIKFYLQKEKDLTKTDLEKTDYKEALAQKKEILKLVEGQYKTGTISENDVINLLGAEGFETSEVDYHLLKWKPATKIKTSKPEKGDLKKWCLKKIVSRETFIEEMRGLGFADKYINYYLKELGKREI
jgi:hypothetical protein